RRRSDPVFARVEQVLRDIEPIWQAADSNGDGRVTEGEWPEQKIAEADPDLEGLAFGEWDRDGDGAVTAQERRALVEIAFGIRRAGGQLLRKPDGHVFYWGYLRYLDENHDDELSRSEFVTRYFEGAEKNSENFPKWDKNGDDRLTWDELAFGGLLLDVYLEFCK